MSIIKTLIATLGLLATSGLTILAAPPATANHTTDHQPAIDVEKFLTSGANCRRPRRLWRLRQ
ncbi:MAG: hypothetical protein V9E81_15095 [Marmoricola sp.]